MPPAYLDAAVAVAITDNTQIGASAQDLYKELSSYRLKELKARVQLCESLAHRHVVASDISYFDNQSALYLDSDYRKIITHSSFLPI